MKFCSDCNEPDQCREQNFCTARFIRERFPVEETDFETDIIEEDFFIIINNKRYGSVDAHSDRDGDLPGGEGDTAKEGGGQDSQ